ncbi:hypothetical protein [Butyrivibrio sp. FC2001]|uniref:hypothetical protein n=1 Tax=Butyrivibrio sp. FC2001 TaxID=1280671 RepID=UPI0004048B10|nr:hypothetical protein [Butyrivibrio sp. FC2001]
MRNYKIWGIILGTAILAAGCSKLAAENKAVETKSGSDTDWATEINSTENAKADAETDTSATDTDAAAGTADIETTDEAQEDTATQEEAATEEASDETTVPETTTASDGTFDRTYLEENNGQYTYRLTDQALIEKYNELYADAFASVIDSYNYVMEQQNQSYNSGNDYSGSSLVLRDNKENSFMKTGSYYEMDYNFDLHNVGYTYVDLDSDGTYEMLFGVMHDSDSEWSNGSVFERAFALVDGKVVKICEGGSRESFWLGSDGYIYNYGSGGAAYWGTERMHFDVAEIANSMDLRDIDWGNRGFMGDEYLGYYERPIHITGDYTDLYTAAQDTKNDITEDEFNTLNDEWDSRQIIIDWIQFPDNLIKNS